MSPAPAYILCTTPRSGSTLLCRMLAASGIAGAPDSHFHSPSLDRWLEVYGLAAIRFPDRRAAIRAAIAAGKARGMGASGCFGLRLQRGSFAYLMDQLDILHPGLASDRSRIEAAFGPVTFLHLSRADKLAQAVSRLRAEQSGLWHAHADGTEMERTRPAAPPRYDRAAIAAHLAELSALDGAWTDWFAAEGIAPKILSYEALAADPRGVLAQTLSALGHDPARAAAVSVPTARLADAESAAWIARFRAETAGPIPPRS